MRQVRPFLLMIVTVPWLLIPVIGWCGSAYAAGFLKFKTEERPAPEFSTNGAVISAKLIPRAKNSSVVISFRAANGRLESVRGVDFESVARGEVDEKNFKSAVFKIKVNDIAPGGTTRIVISSDFFTASTAFYAFNPNLATAWMDTRAVNTLLPDRVRELAVTVRDGGPRDADGAADGRVTLIGGPRDSFWGYALGTLFIRFFGIFIVLTLLMIGLTISGLIFSRVGKGAADGDQTTSAAIDQTCDTALSAEPPVMVTDEEVAAIAAALFLLRQSDRAAMSVKNRQRMETAENWAVEGRRRQMDDRLVVFRRS